MGRFHIKLPKGVNGAQERWQLVSEAAFGPRDGDPGLLKLLTYDGWEQHQDPYLLPRTTLRLLSDTWRDVLTMGTAQANLLSFTANFGAGWRVGRSYRWRVGTPKPAFPGTFRMANPYSVGGAGANFTEFAPNTAYSLKAHETHDLSPPDWVDRQYAFYLYFNFDYIRAYIPHMTGEITGGQARFVLEFDVSIRWDDEFTQYYGPATTELRDINAHITDLSNSTGYLQPMNFLSPVPPELHMNPLFYPQRGVRDIPWPDVHGEEISVIRGFQGEVNPRRSIGEFTRTFDISVEDLMNDHGRIYGFFVDEVPWWPGAPRDTAQFSGDFSWSALLRCTEASFFVRGKAT